MTPPKVHKGLPLALSRVPPPVSQHALATGGVQKAPVKSNVVELPRSLGTLTVWQLLALPLARLAPPGNVLVSTQAVTSNGNVPLAHAGISISIVVVPVLSVVPVPMGLFAQSKRLTLTPLARLPLGHATTTVMGQAF